MNNILLLCLFCFMFWPSEGAKILGIFHVPTKSHFIVGQSVLKGLADKGHDVTIASPFRSKEKNNYKEIYLEHLQEIGEESRKEMFQMANVSTSTMLQKFSNFSNSLAEVTLKNPGIQKLIKNKENFDVIIMEQFSNEAFFGLGHIFNAHIIVIATGSSDFVNHLVGNVAPYSFVPHVLTSFSDKMTFVQRAMNIVASIFTNLYINFLILPAQKQIYEEVFPNCAPFEDTIKNVSLLLVNTHVIFESPRPYLPNMIQIGGVHINNPKPLPNRLLFNFTTAAKAYNMEVSPRKTKSMVVSKEPIRCKLEIENEMIEQVMKFNYLGVEISSYRNTKNEVKQQVMKGARISGYLCDYLKTELDNAKEGVILFSLGSNLNSKHLPENKIKEILKTFAKFPQKILWKYEDESLKKNLPKNVQISSWYPQSDILAHPNVKLFITHGGLLSSTEAVYRGVPIIGIPIYGDQYANIAKFVSYGYGQQILLEDLTEETFTKTIKNVLENKSYSEKIKHSSEILKDNPQPPLDRAIFWIEHVIRTKGARHLRSASIDLSLPIYLLLDVLAFAGIVTGTFIAGIYLVIRTLCCRKQEKEERRKRKTKRE